MTTYGYLLHKNARVVLRPAGGDRIKVCVSKAKIGLQIVQIKFGSISEVG